MQFEFVDNATASGDQQRRLIRRHVMKGKNAGKTHPQRKRPTPKAVVHPVVSWGRTEYPPGDEALRFVHYDKRILSLRRLLWNDMAAVRFPVDLDAETRGLVHQWFTVIAELIYPPEFCRKADLMASVWVQYLMNDEAYFHCTLAMSISFINFLKDKPGVPPDALRHMSKAYRLVSTKLSSAGAEAVSNAALGVVIILAIFERSHKQNQQALVHFQGLKRMIELRGGMEGLVASNRSLVQKIWRLDLEFALQDGMETDFFGASIPLNTILDDIRDDSKLPAVLDMLSPGLRRPAVDMVSLARLINEYCNSSDDGQNNKLHPYAYTEALSNLCYQLIHFRSLKGRPLPNKLHNLCHLAMLTFVTVLLPDLGRGLFRYQLLGKQLSAAIRESQVDKGDETQRFLVWCLFLGGTSLFEASDDEWLMPLLAATCRDLDMVGWAEIRDVLVEFSWIHVLQDKAGEELWKSVHGSGRVQENAVDDE